MDDETLKQYPDEELVREQNRLNYFLKWSRSLCGINGGWMLWDSDNEANAERRLDQINGEIQRRKTSKIIQP